MVDRLTPEQRSRLMRRIRSRDTGPERSVRSMLHRLGCRFRLHRKDLPGTPDIVLPSRGVVVFVHGCFWHGHICSGGKLPATKIEYWGQKIEANRRRDKRAGRRLRSMGWRVITVWECELKRPLTLERRLLRHLNADRYAN
ncbi:MAG TPA: DNA mismatch endonuclease Vsr [Luteimonas sp.]|nr:DNA mismatch endonuclease Vsr [Luteimonas sp.]